MNENPPPLRCARKREDEKTRSKTNRKQFKCLIEQLNNCVSDLKLNNNNTLEIAVAMMKLNTFYNPKDNNTTPNGSFSVDHFLKISNSVGIGFLRSGVIVYATEQLADYFKDIKYLIGCHLAKISYNSTEIIKHLFVDNRTDFLLQIKRNYRSKKTLDIFITGKLMYSPHGEAMFLGYSKIKPFLMFKNPSLSVTGCYMVTSSELEILKGHPYIDYLLNTKMKSTAAAMYPHPDDMANAASVFLELRTKGFVQSVVRLIRMEDDGKHKYLHCLVNMNIFKDVNGATKIASAVWPYAFTVDGNNFSVNDIELINMNPVWSADLNYNSKQFLTAVAHSEGIFGESSSEEGKSGYMPVHSPDPPNTLDPQVLPGLAEALKGVRLGGKQAHQRSSASRANSNSPQYQLSGKCKRVKSRSSQYTFICEKDAHIIGVSGLRDGSDAIPRAGSSIPQDIKVEFSGRFPPNFSSICIMAKSTLVNVKVGPDDTMMKNDFYQPQGHTLVPTHSGDIAAPINSGNVPAPTHSGHVTTPSGESAGHACVSNSVQPVLKGHLIAPVPGYNSQVPPSGSCSLEPDLLPTIEPKLEMYDILDTMPQNISIPGDKTDCVASNSIEIQPTSSGLQTAPHSDDRILQLDYSPLTEPPCSTPSQGDQGDLTFDPPLEISQIMNDFWSADDLF